MFDAALIQAGFNDPSFRDRMDPAVRDRLFGGDPNKMPTGLGASGRRAWLEGKQAEITRAQWQQFQQLYAPLQKDLIAKAMQTDFSVEGDQAGMDAAASAQAARGTLARNMSRLGTRMTAEQAEAVRRRSQLGLTKGVAQAENTTRRGLYDSRGNLLAGITALGQGHATGAMSGFNAAANNAASQEMALNAGAAAAHNTNVGMGMSALALLMMM